MTSSSDWQGLLTVTPLSESASIVRIGDGERIELEIVEIVTALTATLDADSPIGVLEIVPAYATILLEYDPMLTDAEAVERAVREAAHSTATVAHVPARVVEIPTCYGGDLGPDLDDMADEVGLAPDEVIRLHAGANYRVACMGFSPGWAYLMGLPAELEVPRLRIPRTRIPAGSVAVGGAQTGVYPLESPGGWRLIGRTPLRLFDPDRPEPFSLRPGDGVRFVPVSADEYATVVERLEGGGDGE